MKKSILAISLMIAGLSNSALASDTVLNFFGTCDNDLCTSSGANGTVPATVTASITLTDLTWIAQNGVFVADFSSVKNFSYQGPKKFALANTSGVSMAGTEFISSTASVEGMSSFDISYADGAAFFAGDTTGWGLGFYLATSGGYLPMNFESSTRSGQWTVASVPEPESYALFLAGLGLMGAVARRRSRKQ